jgi:SAM-dependent methyltransferase
MKLNLGSSDEILEGFLNVDVCPPADFIADLTQAWPWEDGSIEHIRAWDIIEHLPDSIHTMNEMWRVLRPGGTAEIVVPTTDGRGAWQDPQHVSFWNRNSFFYYTDGNRHRERFGEAYGIRARFSVEHERQRKHKYKVEKLTIVLKAVK